MDVRPSSDDVLAQPTRSRIFALLVERRAAMSTNELAGPLGLHVNGVRRHLERLRQAGLVERRRSSGARGRPGDLWLVAAGARPGGERPTGYAEMARWLARATPGGAGRLRALERSGREIGQELASDTADDPVEGFRAALAALGFEPAIERDEAGSFACRLDNCPYRDSALESPDVVCTMHRGITAGLLEILDPGAKLTRFEPHDPRRAGCLVEVETAAAATPDP
jgi:predicted ArsR family transcriptional regulator